MARKSIPRVVRDRHEGKLSMPFLAEVPRRKPARAPRRKSRRAA